MVASAVMYHPRMSASPAHTLIMHFLIYFWKLETCWCRFSDFTLITYWFVAALESVLWWLNESARGDVQMKVSGITRQQRPTWFNCFQVEHVNATQKLLLVWPYHQRVNAASVQHGSVFLFMWGGIKLVRGDDDVPFRVCILFNFLKNGSQVFFSSAGGCLCPDGTGSFEFQDTFTSFLSETKPKILFTCWEAQKRCQLGCTSCI